MLGAYTEDGTERLWFDVLSAVVLFMTAIGGAWLPRYLCSPGAAINGSQSLAFHLGNMLSAGVMLSAGFCHLLADAHRSLLFVGRFPVSNFLAATGYIITLLADQVVQLVSEQVKQQPAAGDGVAGTTADGSSSGYGSDHRHHHHYHHDGNGSGAGDGGGGGGGGFGALFGRGNSGYSKLATSGAELTVLASGTENSGGGRAQVVSPPEGVLTKAMFRETAATGNGLGPSKCGGGHCRSLPDPESGGGTGAGVSGRDGVGIGVGAADGKASPPLSASNSLKRSHSQGRGQGHGGAAAGGGVSSGGGVAGGDCHSSGVVALLGTGGRKLSFATAVLLASALCIHSILEGMALGAQQSMRSTEDIMVAIAAHKGLAAYALGASIMESGASSNRFWTVIGCFSLATPLGIFAGYGMSNLESSKGGAALSALASGTFLYVAFMEVIPKELADGRNRAAKMAAFLLGYGLMSLLAVWA